MGNRSLLTAFYSLLTVAMMTLSPAAKSAMPQHNIYLTATEHNGVPQAEPKTEFSCSDKIYAVLELDSLERTTHKLNAIWRDPHGKDRERTEYEFMVTRKQERIWVWLKLHRSTEAALVSFVNPSAGMDEFIGDWELILAIDDKPIETKSFSVLC